MTLNCDADTDVAMLFGSYNHGSIVDDDDAAADWPLMMRDPQSHGCQQSVGVLEILFSCIWRRLQQQQQRQQSLQLKC